MGKRIQYLDLLKAIAIFLVVFCHFVLLSETVAANLFMSACWMAVPIFFMVNGALLFSRPLDFKKHLKKTLSVYLVLSVWKLVYLLVIPPATGANLNGVGVGTVLNYLFLFGEIPEIVNGHLWFIEALLAVYLIFPALRVAYACRSGAISSRRLTWYLAIASLACTNGLHSLEVFGSMLRDLGLPFSLSFDSLAAFQPFGKYGNMLGFFLLGGLLSSSTGLGLKNGRAMLVSGSAKQRLVGAAMLLGGLFALWGVKCYLSGQAAWDGILLQEGYRHVPVIFMAVGLFMLCKDLKIKNRWAAAFVEALASRTLGIFYLHWVFGWLLVNPLAAFLVSHGIGFSVGANILKNIVLMVPAFLIILLLERIPLVKRLVTG